MAKRRFTLVVVPHSAEPSKIIEVSFNLLRAGAAVALVVVLAAVLVGAAVVARGRAGVQMPGRANENVELSAEIGRLQNQLSTLSDTLTQISRRDAKIRLLANLEPLGPEVQAAGIGGPVPTGGTPLPDTRLGARTAEVRVDLNALIRRANVLASSFREAADSLGRHTARLAATPSIMPTQGWLSSAYSAMRSHPLLHVARPHEGIDVSAPMGTPIEAPAAGTIVEAGRESGYGNIVVIDHGFGTVTKFAHAQKLLVKRGQKVKRGERIALVGNSGLATGPHLHYEVHVNGRPVNPMNYVLPQDAVVD